MAEIKTVLSRQAGGANLNAFLDMIKFSELGNELIKRSDGGYNVIVGSYWLSQNDNKLDLFSSYADHPRKKVVLPKLRITSTAAGAYQILSRYFDAYKVQLKLPDFSPMSQDLIALQLIRECRATDDIRQGNFATAVLKCRSRWASLPGAGYGQREHGIDKLLLAYRSAGGSVA